MEAKRYNDFIYEKADRHIRDTLYYHTKVLDSNLIQQYSSTTQQASLFMNYFKLDLCTFYRTNLPKKQHIETHSKK